MNETNREKIKTKRNEIASFSIIFTFITLGLGGLFFGLLIVCYLDTINAIFRLLAIFGLFSVFMSQFLLSWYWAEVYHDEKIKIKKLENDRC